MDKQVKDLQVKKPEKLDLKRGRDIAKKVMEQNVEWLREMAKR